MRRLSNDVPRSGARWSIAHCARVVLSPSPEQVEYAEMLQRLATGDLYAIQKLADDADVDDYIIGFHAQQVVEKALKVALVLVGSELPRTHDLELLVAGRGGWDNVPDELSGINWLTPRTAELRYDEPIAQPRWQWRGVPSAGRHRCSKTPE